MSVRDLLLMGGGGGLVFLLTLIQVSPIKINPWTWIGNHIGKPICKAIGGSINKEVLEKIATVQQDVSGLKEEVRGVKSDVAEVRQDVAVGEAKREEDRIIICRTRILRFGDEVAHGVHHSKEHFDQIMADMTEYETYCHNHKEFQNDRTVETSAIIKKIYQECLVTGNFL